MLPVSKIIEEGSFGTNPAMVLITDGMVGSIPGKEKPCRHCSELKVDGSISYHTCPNLVVIPSEEENVWSYACLDCLYEANPFVVKNEGQ